ncbi:MAG: hypothetical protein ABIS50_25420 [Luteolibacter sp.]|uniref:hypothetical protein n=1 Tax=Luteolibacter sp. TaxID=1962973 RepID=UPI003267BC66
MENPATVIIADKQLRCLHCGHDQFFKSLRRLTTAEFDVLDLVFPHQTAETYVCSHCGRVEWFIPPVRDGMTGSTEGDFDCLECGGIIPNGQKACPACGWTYVP